MPGIEPLVAAAAGLRPENVVGCMEAVLIEWNHIFEEEPTFGLSLRLPVVALFCVELSETSSSGSSAGPDRRDAPHECFKTEAVVQFAPEIRRTGADWSAR